jgi:hypothetical protein
VRVVRGHRFFRGIVATAVATAAAAFACTVAVAAPSNVALGDSYAAGPFIPLPIKPWGCLKSDHNYENVS